MNDKELEMKRYSANYVLASSNFVVQNLRGGVVDKDLLPCLNVVRNIIQRGCPTMMSRYLQEQVKGVYDLKEDKKFTFWLGKNPKGWQYTIKGAENGYNPAKMFYEEIVPSEFGEAVQAMIIPEYGINDIVGVENEAFVGQDVDFYLPQALLVIEIDGGQHEEEKALDESRVNYLNGMGVKTIRITTNDLRSGRYRNAIEEIRSRLQEERFARGLSAFCDGYAHLQNWDNLSEWEKMKFRLTAVIRFELLLLDLLERGYLKLGEEWNLNVRCDEPLDSHFMEWAIEDLYLWLGNVVRLRDKRTLDRFVYKCRVVEGSKFRRYKNAVNIDFSVMKRWTDENRDDEGVVFVRGDYFEYDEYDFRIGDKKNNFRVSISDPINYHITEDDKLTLEFFLQNIFGKEHFRDGQVAIIANALNMEDTVGLLPTGGGKSLCYQLPCLLQPCINFVVCPIKLLMINQVENLKFGYCRIGNINYINSDVKGEDRGGVIRNYSEGKYLFVLIAPERFQTVDFRKGIRNIARYYKMAYAVIDEVHCMSEWGHGFRTSYLNLTQTIDKMSPKDENGEGIIKFLGLTATASLSVLKDIKVEFARGKQQLNDTNVKSLLDYSREELVFEVRRDKGKKYDALIDIFEENDIPNDEDKATVVFTPNVDGENGCYELSLKLERTYPLLPIVFISGRKPINYQLPDSVFDEYKRNAQEDFIQNKARVACATKAFGMGIDKDNIYYTVHYGLPSSIEALYQEAGRAGRWAKTEENRDKKAKCYVLYTDVYKDNESKVNSIFIPKAPISEIKPLQGDMRLGDDIGTQLYLLLYNMRPIEFDYEMIGDMMSEYYEPNKVVRDIDRFVTVYKKNRREEVYYKEVEAENNYIKVEIDREVYLYRLKLMGVVKDWMVQFKERKLIVKFGEMSDESVLSSLEKFVWRYNPTEKVREKIMQQVYTSVFDKAVMYLLEWIHETMVENRKQSLKNVKELCEGYTTSEAFKKRLDAYFTFTESTFVLQYISENPTEYKKWFEVLYDDMSNIINIDEFMNMKDRVNRFMESFHNNVGLNFVSGMVRLKLGEFDNVDGRDRLRMALEYVIKEMAVLKMAIYEKIIKLLGDMELEGDSLMEVCVMMAEYYPEKVDDMRVIFDLSIFENELIESKIKELRTLKNKLYEHCRKIQ